MEANWEVLRLARESRGLSQKDLASKLNIEQGTLSKIENQLLPIDEELILKYSEALEYPISFFYQQRPVHLIEGHYRKKITLPQREVKMQQAKMTILEWHLEKLIESVELPKPNIPSWDCSFDGSPEMCAQYVREFWRIPRGRIPNINKIIEDNGVVVIPMDLGKLDGFSGYSRTGIPIIYINREVPGDRYRFNLAHELGHLIMHFTQKIDESRDIESEAHWFASEFLIPGKEIKPHLTRLNLDKLAQLKAYWKVSMQAILVKSFKHVSILSKNQYHYLWKQMSALGYRKNEPVFIPVEQPHLLKEIIDLYLGELKYSKPQLAGILNLTVKEFDNIYLQSNTLRIVA